MHETFFKEKRLEDQRCVLPSKSFLKRTTRGSDSKSTQKHLMMIMKKETSCPQVSLENCSDWRIHQPSDDPLASDITIEDKLESDFSTNQRR